MTEEQRMLDEQYHGHPNYVHIWAILLGLFALSMVVALLGHAGLSLFIVFVTAVIKSMYVVNQFMHLQWEPKMFLWLTLGSLLIVAFFYFGVYPDIVPIDLKIAK